MDIQEIMVPYLFHEAEILLTFMRCLRIRMWGIPRD